MFEDCMYGDDDITVLDEQVRQAIRNTTGRGALVRWWRDVALHRGAAGGAREPGVWKGEITQ